MCFIDYYLCALTCFFSYCSRFQYFHDTPIFPPAVQWDGFIFVCDPLVPLENNNWNTFGGGRYRCHRKQDATLLFVWQYGKSNQPNRDNWSTRTYQCERGYLQVSTLFISKFVHYTCVTSTLLCFLINISLYFGETEFAYLIVNCDGVAIFQNYVYGLHEYIFEDWHT